MSKILRQAHHGRVVFNDTAVDCACDENGKNEKQIGYLNFQSYLELAIFY